MHPSDEPTGLRALWIDLQMDPVYIATGLWLAEDYANDPANHDGS